MTTMRGFAFAGAWMSIGMCGCDELVPSNTVFAVPPERVFEDARAGTGPLPGESHVVITNNLDDTFNVLSLDSIDRGGLDVIRTAPVGLHAVEREGPHHAVGDVLGEHVYIGISNYVPGAGSGPHGLHGSGTADGYALKVRMNDAVVVGSVRVDPNPGDIRLTPNGQQLLVSHYDVARVAAAGDDDAAAVARLAVIDVASFTRTAMIDLCPAPHGIAVSPDGRYVYASCISDEMAVVDLQANPPQVTRVDVDNNDDSNCGPYAVVVSPNGNDVYVSCLQNGQVRRYDVAAGGFFNEGSYQLPGGAVFGAFTRDGARLVMPHQTTDGLAIINATEQRIERVVSLPAGQCVLPHVVRYTDDETRLMLVCEGTRFAPGTFLVLDAATFAIQQSTPLGLYPDDIAVVRRP
jgi:DNA-binding beta-propeller fold protein YncE